MSNKFVTYLLRLSANVPSVSTDRCISEKVNNVATLFDFLQGGPRKGKPLPKKIYIVLKLLPPYLDFTSQFKCKRNTGIL